MLLPLLLLCFLFNNAHANTLQFADYPYQLINEPIDNNPPASDVIDLEDLSQDFILETKRIEFPEYPDAFNPSLIRWRGSLLMSFRIYKPHNRSTNPFGLVFLDEDFNPVGTPQVFELPFYNPVLLSKQQDPRLIPVGDRLFVVYNNLLPHITHREIRRMYMAELFFDGTTFTASEPECLSDFEGQSDMRYEKNWVPFDYQGKLLLAYSLFPHTIFHPVSGTNSCQTISSCSGKTEWDWGEPRGGTQAVRINDHYLAFFHSRLDLPTVQSNGRKMTHYFMGAYTFQAKPPFAITAISPEPIIGKDFYRPPYYKTWKPLRCVFPCGLVVDKKYVWVAYGRQDHEIWVVKFDKKKLYKSLVPVHKQ
jgi:predicted GH43/DUF377 family glycosyl hydrolase